MASTKFRDRKYMLLLYPDNESHCKAMENIAKNYDYCSILHDRDTFTKQDEEINPDHKAGKPKKAHWHIVLKFKDAVWNTALAKDLGIEEKFIEKAKNLDRALAYLLHYYDTDKEQYCIEEVDGPLQVRLHEILNKEEKTEGEKVGELIEWITSRESRITVTEFARYCAVNGFWSEFRRSGAIFCKIIDEHNHFQTIALAERSNEREKNK